MRQHEGSMIGTNTSKIKKKLNNNVFNSPVFTELWNNKQWFNKTNGWFVYTEPLQQGLTPDSSGVSGTKNSIFFIMHEVKKGYLSTEVTKRQKVEPGQYLALDGGQQLLKKC